MKRTLLIESLLGETRLAVIEDDRLCEYYVERPDGEDVAGSIYLGRVENVVPGMNAAFVNIGQEKNGYLYAGDIQITDRSLSDRLGSLRIEKLVRPGGNVLVQVVKAQTGQKGPRLSCHITIPGRLLVLLADVNYIGVSRKITDDDKRASLRDAAKRLTGVSGMGVIVRTAAETAPIEALEAEYNDLIAQWKVIKTQAEHAIPPMRVFSNASLISRCVRDMLDDTVDAIWADGQNLYDAIVAEAGGKTDRIRLHDSPTPLFDLHRVDTQLDKALRKYVWLKSGGSLVIEETEAMTVIDVNTAKFTGKKVFEDTVFKLNCEAAEELVRQIRLRDLGGIIIVDFIDMRDPAHNEALIELLNDLAKTDRSRLTVIGMTGLGLVELTRKRERKPLSKQLLHICSCCHGDGMSPSHETTARRALHELWRRRRGGTDSPLMIKACPAVANYVRAIGAPEGGSSYASADEGLPMEEYAIEPADEAHLPPNTWKLTPMK